MFDIENELKALGAKKLRPDETLRQRTVEKLAGAQHKAAPRARAMRWATASAAVAVLAAVLLFVMLPGTGSTSYFTIDINPSIGIETDANGTILSVKAQNSDAEALLASLDLAGMSFIDALQCVVRAAEEQGYLKDNGHVLVAHFGVTASVSEAQVEAAVNESTHKQVNVLLLESSKRDYKKADQTHQSAGISLLMRNAQKCGLEDANIETIIETVKKNNHAANDNGSSQDKSAAPAASETGQANDTPANPEKSNNGSNGNHGNNGKKNDEDNPSNSEPSDKADKADKEDKEDNSKD